MLRSGFPLWSAQVITDSPNNPFYVPKARPSPAAASQKDTALRPEPIRGSAHNAELPYDILQPAVPTPDTLSTSTSAAASADHPAPASPPISPVSNTSPKQRSNSISTTTTDQPISTSTANVATARARRPLPSVYIVDRQWLPVTQSPNNPFDVSYHSRERAAATHQPQDMTSPLPDNPPSFLSPYSDLDTHSHAAHPLEPPLTSDPGFDDSMDPSFPPMSDTFEQEYALTAAREHAQDIFHKPEALQDLDGAPTNLSTDSHTDSNDTSEPNGNRELSQAVKLDHGNQALFVPGLTGQSANHDPAPPVTTYMIHLESTTSEAVHSTIKTETATAVHARPCRSQVNHPPRPATALGQPSSSALSTKAALDAVYYYYRRNSFPAIIEDAGQNPFWVPSHVAAAKPLADPSH